MPWRASVLGGSDYKRCSLWCSVRAHLRGKQARLSQTRVLGALAACRYHLLPWRSGGSAGSCLHCSPWCGVPAMSGVRRAIVSNIIGQPCSSRSMLRVGLLAAIGAGAGWRDLTVTAPTTWVCLDCQRDSIVGGRDSLILLTLSAGLHSSERSRCPLFLSFFCPLRPYCLVPCLVPVPHPT